MVVVGWGMDLGEGMGLGEGVDMGDRKGDILLWRLVEERSGP